MKSLELSVIVPVYNEEKNIQILYREIVNVLKNLIAYEIIFVDDGSTDDSFKIAKKIAAKDRRVKIVKLLSNYGQSNAIAAGISKSKGNIIATMDSDLQHDPRDIMQMIKKVREGYHLVCGWRKDRHSSDSFLKKTLPSKISNFLIRKLTGIKLHDSTGGMRAFSRKVVETVPYYGEMHRYLPILANWKGFKIVEVPINIRKRRFGSTKYNYKRILRGFMDLITIKFFIKYSIRPFRVFGTIGVFSLLLGFFIVMVLLYLKLFHDIRLLRETASMLLAVVFILLGIMFMGFGFIADMISYDAVTSQKRETYIVDKVIAKNN